MPSNPFQQAPHEGLSLLSPINPSDLSEADATPETHGGMTRRVLISSGLIAGLAGLALLLPGCAGSSSNPDSPTPTPASTRYLSPSLMINWAARTRDISAPASALSAKIIFTGDNGATVQIIANRDATKLAAYSDSYGTGYNLTLTGKAKFDIVFYSDASASGVQVASASTSVDLDDSGKMTSAVSNVQNSIKYVEVTAGQSVNTGAQTYLTFTARKSATGDIVAVSPGSASFAVASGADVVSITGGVATGLSGGTAMITATVDGITSQPATLTVVPSVKIAFVADSRDAEVVALNDLMTNYKLSYTLYTSLPDAATLQQFDVLMVGATGAKSTDADAILAYANTGRGVILTGTAPASLAGTYTTNRSRFSLQSISSWFAGVAYMSVGAGADIFTTTSQILPLTITTNTKVYGNADGEYYRAVIDRDDMANQTADIVLYYTSYKDVSAFAYQLPSGGRIYWQFHPYGLNRDYTSKIFALLIAGMNWAAKR